MKTIAKLAVAFAATTALNASIAYASGGAGPSVTASATANVIAPVTITQGTGLSFGTFAPSTTTAGTITSSGTAVNVSPITAGTPATFNVVGQGGTPYTIVGDPSVTLSDTVNSNNPSMVATLVYPTPLTRTLGVTTGADSFNVSGTLSVAANQPADPYSGTYTVSVHY